MRKKAQYLKEIDYLLWVKGVLNHGLWTSEIAHKVLRIYIHIFLGRRSTF